MKVLMSWSRAAATTCPDTHEVNRAPAPAHARHVEAHTASSPIAEALLCPQLTVKNVEHN